MTYSETPDEADDAIKRAAAEILTADKPVLRATLAVVLNTVEDRYIQADHYRAHGVNKRKHACDLAEQLEARALGNEEAVTAIIKAILECLNINHPPD